jgi:prepilin-type N-terminal cleavage/methylation domain-containing protein
MERAYRRTAGFSLIELMIAVGILLVVVTAVMQSFVVQNKAYTVTDQVIEAQQSLRAVAWLLERDARMTGFLVPEAAAVCGVDEQNQPDRVWFTDADALSPVGQTRPALGAVVIGGYNGSASPQTIQLESGTGGVVLDPTPTGAGGYYDLDGDGDGDADFIEDAGAILVDLDDPAGGVACGIVTAVDVGAGTVRVDFEATIPIPPAGNNVILVPAHVYDVQVPAGGGEPQLRRNGRAIASGVEDLQFAFFFDVDRDGQVDNAGQPNSEMPGEDGAADYESDDHDNRDLREIRINLVTRTRQPDRDTTTGQFQAYENRVAPGGNDGYRRRVHTSTVKLRNVGYRGTAT